MDFKDPKIKSTYKKPFHLFYKYIRYNGVIS